jgi:predicted Zn-ribbon and HTH transcriptional regulator
MTLHETIIRLLKESRHPMTAQEIADALNENKRYEKRDNSLIKGSQISARVNKYPKLFEVNREVSPMTINAI